MKIYTRAYYQLRLLLLACALVCCTVSAAAGGEVIYYPRSTADNDPHLGYVLELLNEALRNSGGAYVIQATASPMPQTRAINEAMASKGSVDLLWSMTTDERESHLIPIRIPIDKGLIGWRIAFVHGSKKDIFRNIRSQRDLNNFHAGQVHDWPDTGILRSNGLQVTPTTTYEALFRMLQAERFDYMPRAIFEIWQEQLTHSEFAIEIDPYIVLHYPSAYYFFVSPRHPEFAETLRTGLEQMLSNGSFEKIFQKHFQAALQKSRLSQRVVIELHNPLLQKNKLSDAHPELQFKP